MFVQMDGEQVRSLREMDEASVAELAKRAGISPDTLRRAERNGGPVRVKTARAIGGALDVDPRSIARAVWTRRPVGRFDVEAHELHA
jgi:transcriptional regulator with XRE-family HTH domain